MLVGVASGECLEILITYYFLRRQINHQKPNLGGEYILHSYFRIGPQSKRPGGGGGGGGNVPPPPIIHL